MKPLHSLPLFGYADGDVQAGLRPPPPPEPLPIYPPYGVGFKGEAGGASELAAKAVASTSAHLRGLVLKTLNEAEAETGFAFDGITSDEIAARLIRHPLSIQPRTSELFKEGLIEKGKTLGRSALGSPATRWKIKRETSAPLVPRAT